MAYTTIDNPELYFQVKLFTGDASATSHTLGGSENMQPDLAWFKSRSRADNSRIVDALRTTYSLKSNENDAQVDSSGDGFTSLDADGFTLNGSGGGGEFNAASGTYVAWCWKAGTTSGINTTGSDITPDAYSFNQTSGFSIIKYEGIDTADTQVPHGLGAVPKFGLFKKLESTGHWMTYHHTLDDDEKLYLNDTHAAVTDADAWNETDPTSVNWTIDIEDDANESGEDIVAYSWAEVQGFSKFGSYIGNASTDGTFVYTGFKPAWVMVKTTNTTQPWYMWDNKREGYNGDNETLVANTNQTGGAGTYLSMLANGFKFHTADPEWNGAYTYAYAAFAEQPFVNSNGVPCNAR